MVDSQAQKHQDNYIMHNNYQDASRFKHHHAKHSHVMSDSSCVAALVRQWLQCTVQDAAA